MGCCFGKGESAISSKFFPTEVRKAEAGTAVLVGRRGAGVAQYRGCGSLVLSPNQLWFRGICCSEVEVEVPLSEIRNVKSVGGICCTCSSVLITDPTEALEVTYTGDPGAEERVRFAVPDAESWREAIVAAAEENRNYRVAGW